MKKGTSVRHVCNLCNKSFCRKIKDHMILCVGSNLSDGNVKNYLLLIEAEPNMFLYILVPRSLTLKQLAKYINETWMDCGCGHLYQFQSITKYKQSTKLKDVDFPCSYEYDMGSTTACNIILLGTITTDNTKIKLLLRNTIPTLKCSVCKNSVEKYCVECSEVYCRKCLEKPKYHSCCEDSDFEEMILPYVNSPRTFICGYTG